MFRNETLKDIWETELKANIPLHLEQPRSQRGVIRWETLGTRLHLTLNDWSRGEQWILFPENLIVSRDEVEGNIEIRGQQISLFPKGPVIKWFVIEQNKTKANV